MSPIVNVPQYVCDACDQVIDAIHPKTVWVEANGTDKIFHYACWVKANGPQVARLLGLGNIHYRGADMEGQLAWGPEWRSTGQ